jgi:hypothetical protein
MCTGSIGRRPARIRTLDTRDAPVHTRTMGERPAKRHRVFVEDARRNGSYLRATWHPDRRMFVLSTWNGDVCTGAVQLPAAEAADLIGLVADGLAEMAETASPRRPPVGKGRGDLRTRLTRWLGGGADRAATILPLRNISRTSERRRRSA